MPEIRKDYATDTWVVFSAARSRRPGAFRNAKASTPKEDCPFCVGHEAMTPPEVLAYRDRGPTDGPGWRIRCVPNMFPALEASGDVRRHEDGLFVSVDGVGAHEIIVESPDHEGHMSTLEDAQVAEVLRAYRDRYRALATDPRVRYVLIFKNHGERAGASLSHPHSQLVATPIVPLRILDELEGVQSHRGSKAGLCLYCDVVAEEREARQRIVAEDERFVLGDDPLTRFPFLRDHVAIKAQTRLRPAVRLDALQLVQDSKRDDGSRDELGVRMGERRARALSVVLEDQDVTDPRIRGEGAVPVPVRS